MNEYAWIGLLHLYLKEKRLAEAEVAAKAAFKVAGILLTSPSQRSVARGVRAQVLVTNLIKSSGANIPIEPSIPLQ